MAGALSEISTWLVICTTVACMGNSFLYGYNIGVLNTPAPIIRQFINETYTNRTGEEFSETQVEIIFSVTVSIFVLSGMIGSFMSPKVADSLGRRKGMMIFSAIQFVASILAGMTKATYAPEVLIASRFLVGLHSGCVISLAALYLAEISPKQVRGAIGTCHQLAITIGILVSQVLGLKELMGTEDLWPVLCALHGIPCLICLIAFVFCPESPRFLLLKKGLEDEAVKALQKLRGKQDVSADIDDMRQEAKESQGQSKFSIKMLLTSPELRLPLTIAILLMVAQQWSGINAVFFYSETIFDGAGVQKEYIPYAVVGTGAINVIMTIICVPLMEKLGRRPLLLWPSGLMVLSMVALTLSLLLKSYAPGLAYLSIISMHTYVIGFAMGLGPIPFIVVAELFRQAPRGAAMGISLVFQWMCNFVLAAGFRFLAAAAGPYTFIVFIVILVGAITFIFFFVPETKDKTFDEIAHVLALGGRAGGRKGSADLISKRDEVQLMDLDRKDVNV